MISVSSGPGTSFKTIVELVTPWWFVTPVTNYRTKSQYWLVTILDILDMESDPPAKDVNNCKKLNGIEFKEVSYDHNPNNQPNTAKHMKLKWLVKIIFQL